jgi:1-acyl-sn-glycerol-3-phosphate acyltransferase
MQRLRAAILLSAFLVLTLVLMPVQFGFRLCWPAMARCFPHYYHRVLARLLGFHVETEGVAPATGPALIVANHVSWIDIVAFSAVLPVCFVAKKDVGTWPLFGQLAKLQNSVFVDRERRQATKADQQDIRARLKRGDILVLFPEGTSHDGVNVLPFKTAFFGAVAHDDVLIVPVTIAYRTVCGLPMTRRERPSFAWYGDMDLPPHLWRAIMTGPISIVIRFHAPLRMADARDRKAVAQASQAQIRSSLAELISGR